MNNSTLLAKNDELCIKCARQMRREITARLDYGDTNRVAVALETLAHGSSFPSGERLMQFLGECDAAEFCAFLLHGCGLDSLSDALYICTGKNRLAWLALISMKATWEVCPPLHNVQSQLKVAHS